MAKVIESLTRTTSGTTGNIQALGAETLRVQLNVVGVSGTSPTLNVLVEDTLDNGASYNTIAAFAQKTTPGREVLNVTSPFAETLRVSWTVAGTNPSFTFAVDWSLATRRTN